MVLQHPIVCSNVPSDSLDQFSKSFQDIFVEGVINCLSWRYKFFVHNVTAVEKLIIIIFTLLSSDEENFSCAIPHFAVWSRDSSRTPIIHFLLLPYAKFCVNFESSQQILKNFETVRFLLHKQVFRHQYCTIFSHVQMFCWNSMNRIFYSSPFILHSF